MKKNWNLWRRIECMIRKNRTKLTRELEIIVTDSDSLVFFECGQKEFREKLQAAAAETHFSVRLEKNV